MRLPDRGSRTPCTERVSARGRDIHHGGCEAAMSDVYKTIRYQRHGDIGTLTLARPGKRNAQNPLMWEELSQLGAELLPDETLRCLVVTGEGSAFSAGIDLVEGMTWML